MANNGTTHLLLACLAPGDASSRIQAALQKSPVDWPSLYRLAEPHGVVGILASRLNELVEGGLPETPQAPWRSRWNSLAMRDLVQLAAVEEILPLAKRRGIPLMLLKGLAVHLQVYSPHEARGASDVDLLVQPSQAKAAVECLTEAGFRFEGRDYYGRPVRRWSDLFDHYFEALFTRPADRVSVDLHWRLRPGRQERASGFTLSSRIWERPRAFVVGRTSCLLPGREEELLLVCLNLLNGGLFTLRGLCDLVRLSETPSPVDWRGLLALAQEEGLEALAYGAFKLAGEMAPSSVPSFVPSSLASRIRFRRIWSSFLSLNRLLENQGNEWTNLAIRWNGLLFHHRPWVWIPYEMGEVAEWVGWRMGRLFRPQG